MKNIDIKTNVKSMYNLTLSINCISLLSMIIIHFTSIINFNVTGLLIAMGAMIFLFLIDKQKMKELSKIDLKLAIYMTVSVILNIAYIASLGFSTGRQFVSTFIDSL